LWPSSAIPWGISAFQPRVPISPSSRWLWRRSFALFSYGDRNCPGPRGSRFQNFFSKNISIYYLSLALAAASIWISHQLGKSNLGLSLRSIGDDEEASAELGVRVRYAKSVTLFISAALAALAGGTYGILTQYLSPNDVFSIIYSLDAIFISIVGGMGLAFGPFIGALLFSVLEETLNPLAPGAHLLFLGSTLIAIMFLLPKGLLSLFQKTEPPGRSLPEEIEAQGK